MESIGSIPFSCLRGDPTLYTADLDDEKYYEVLYCDEKSAILVTQEVAKRLEDSCPDARIMEFTKSKLNKGNEFPSVMPMIRSGGHIVYLKKKKEILGALVSPDIITS